MVWLTIALTFISSLYLGRKFHLNPTQCYIHNVDVVLLLKEHVHAAIVVMHRCHIFTTDTIPSTLQMEMVYADTVLILCHTEALLTKTATV